MTLVLAQGNRRLRYIYKNKKPHKCGALKTKNYYNLFHNCKGLCYCGVANAYT